jgi:hypothetical protein
MTFFVSILLFYLMFQHAKGVIHRQLSQEAESDLRPAVTRSGCFSCCFSFSWPHGGSGGMGHGGGYGGHGEPGLKRFVAEVPLAL